MMGCGLIWRFNELGHQIEKPITDIEYHKTYGKDEARLFIDDIHILDPWHGSPDDGRTLFLHFVPRRLLLT